jgi:threonine/homoserine/homoserine lactone efflux protein
MLVNLPDLLVFLAAALSLNLTPGNDMMYVLGQSLKGGARTGISASLGIAGGSLIHLGFVALGVAVILAQYPLLFDLIRYAGACYLIWIAYTTLTSPMSALAQDEKPRSTFAAFRDGVLVNLFNPKIIVFMFAFLPPFIRPENGSPLLQLFILGMIFNVGGTVINCIVALFAGKISAALSTSLNFRRWFSRISAGLFVLLAARLVFERK